MDGINFRDDCVSFLLDNDSYFYISFDKWIYVDEDGSITYEHEFDGKWYPSNLTKIIL